VTESANTALSVEQKKHLGRLAAKLFLEITQRWRLNDTQKTVLAGAATRTTISTWRQRVNQQQVLQLGHDTYERIDCIHDIDRLLSCVSTTRSTNTLVLLNAPQLKLYDESLLSTMLNGKVIDLYRALHFLQDSFTAGQA